MMLRPRVLEVLKDNKTDPMCEKARMMLLPKIKKNITISIPGSSIAANKGQELFKVAQVVTVAPQLMLATPMRINIEQKSKTVVEKNSFSAKLPNQNAM
jgi:hypothetical protein